MDPQKQPFSSSNQSDPASATPPADSGSADSGDFDEAKAAAILDAGRSAAHSDTSPDSPSPVAPAQSSFGATPTASSPTAMGDSGATPPSSPVPSGGISAMDPVAPSGMVSPKKSKKLPLIGGIVAALLVILLGASAAAYYVIMNKPQNVLGMALINSFSADKVKSASFDGSFEITPKDSSTITTTFKGASNDDGAFTFSGKLDALVTNVTIDALSADGKTYYVRLGGLEGLAELLGMGASAETSYLSPIITALNDQWVEINQSMIQQLTGSKTSIETKLSEADRKKIEDAYKKNQFLVVHKTFKNEEIKGENSYHYQVIIDKVKVKGFAAAVKEADIPGLKIDAASLKSFNEETDKAKFEKYPVDVWIAKGSKLINQVAFSTVDNGSKIGVRVTIEDYNKPVKVTAPTSSKSLLEVISTLLTGSSYSPDNPNAFDLGSGISL